MGIYIHAGAWRAIAVAFGIAALGLVSLAPAADAATLLSPGAAKMLRAAAEPFGLSSTALTYGGLRDKWLGLTHELADEQVQLALCDGDRDHCVSPAALRLLAIVDDARVRAGRARLGEINRAINLAILPMSDLAQYGQIDVWSAPLVTLAHGAGDCEDYAIAKLVALRLAGVADDDLRIVVMRDTLSGEDHAVTAVRLEGHWLMLDNRRMAMVEDGYMQNVRPLFVIDQHGVSQYVETPMIALNGT